MQKKPTRDVAVESHPNVEEHDVRMGHPVFRISQGTGEDARLSTSVQNYIGNSRRTYSIAASRDARRPSSWASSTAVSTSLKRGPGS